MAHNLNMHITNPDFYNKNPILTNQMLHPDDKFYPNITKFFQLQVTELPA